MKSRTSLFNPTAFKKDITRFAPAWVLYTVGLFMVLTVVMMEDSEYYRSANLADSVAFMAMINLGYGFLNGQLLFGDLFNARYCNALHAMPLRRECWFTTHMASGLLFSFIPNLVMALVALPMLGGGWQTAAWWLLAVDLQYVFFFGLAALSALCVGNRFAMLLVYGIVNFIALIVYWFYHTLYEPLLYGVYIREQPFLTWCPVWKLMTFENIIQVSRGEVPNLTYSEWFVESLTLGEGWGYLAICAGMGVVFAVLALLLYRRRKLECAGDFMAVRALEPVFLVLYTLFMAAGFQIFAELFSVDEYVFLALGLIVGFFTGRMLLMRTTKVFQVKGFIWFGVLAAAFIASMVLTVLDPIGVTRYIPDVSKVDSAKISTSYRPEFGTNDPYLYDDADLQQLQQLHRLILDGQIHSTAETDTDYYSTLSILYRMDSGELVTRRYEVASSSPAGQLARDFYTRPEFVLGTTDLEEFVSRVERVYFDRNKAGVSVGGELHMNYTNRAYIRGLAEAIFADCAEGTMAQSFRYGFGDEDTYGWMEFSISIENSGDTYYDYRNISLYPGNRHTIAYLEANPFPAEEYHG